jgi:glutaredoxin
MKILYSKLNCPGCVVKKNELIKEGVDFKEIKIGVDISVDEFFQKYPDVRSVPFVVEE